MITKATTRHADSLPPQFGIHQLMGQVHVAALGQREGEWADLGFATIGLANQNKVGW